MELRKIVESVQNFYVHSRACVRVGNDVSEWFPVNVGLRQGCVMSLWLFNVYMDGVVREVVAMGRDLDESTVAHSDTIINWPMKLTWRMIFKWE